MLCCCALFNAIVLLVLDLKKLFRVSTDGLLRKCSAAKLLICACKQTAESGSECFVSSSCWQDCQIFANRLMAKHFERLVANIFIP